MPPRPRPRAAARRLVPRYARVDLHAVSLEWEFPAGGKLDFLSAGRQNRDYSAAVCSLDWDNFYERLGGGRFFRAMGPDMKGNYDYVLIDSRTGFSDVADICTIELPDVLTVCFTLSDQSIEGSARSPSRSVIDTGKGTSRFCRSRCASRTAKRRSLTWGERQRAAASKDFRRAVPGGSLTYWSAVEVPYKPFYAFEEILATFGEAPGLARLAAGRVRADHRGGGRRRGHHVAADT